MSNKRCFLQIKPGILLATALCWMAVAPLAFGQQAADKRPAVVIGAEPAAVARLAGVLGDAGFELKTGNGKATLPPGALVLLQPGREMTEELAKSLGEHVRRGGALLLLLPNATSYAGPQLAFMLPTTAWKDCDGRAIGGPIKAAEVDAEFFGNEGFMAQLPLAYHVDVRPFHAAERGQARYERFARVVQDEQWIKQDQKPGDTFWTRSLLNREWTVRMRGDNQAADGLLVTGKYGAGRVAVFGADASQLESWAGAAPATVRKIIDWLAVPAGVVSEVVPALKVTHQIDVAGRQIKVSVTNTSAVAVDAEVIVRLLTWEGTLDIDVSKPVKLAAGETTEVALAAPPVTATSFQATSYADVWDARLGVLTGGGAALSNETRFPVDFRPDPLLTASVDDLFAQDYPYDGPKPSTVPHFQARMGSGTMRYAYKPGEAIHVSLRVANGVRNIAPQAQVADLTTPANPSITALTDGNTKTEQGPTQTIEAYGTWTGADKKDNTVEFTWPQARTVCGVTLVGMADNYRNHLSWNPHTAIIEIDGKEAVRAEDLEKRFPAEMGRVHLAFAPTSSGKLTLRLPWVEGASKAAPQLAEVEIDGTYAGETAPPPVNGQVDVKLIDAETNAVVATQQAAAQVAGDDVAVVSAQLAAPKVADGGPHAYRVEATLAGHITALPLLIANPAHPLPDLKELSPQGTIDFGFIVSSGFRNMFPLGTGPKEWRGGWEDADDLIWCYAHLLKQEGGNSKTLAGRLYVNSNDFRHYISPWRTFPNGQSVMELGAANLYEDAIHRGNWKTATTVKYGFSDRWDTGPSLDALNSWQDFTEFDHYLRHTAAGQGLKGRTRPELAKEVREEHQAEWMAYQKAAYIKALHDLTDRYEAAGKKVSISAQGYPLLAGPSPDSDLVYRLVRGMSDDSTWGMDSEDIPLTTGRQMGALAFNPAIAMSTLFMWGWDSAALNNPFWRVPVGTTEPSRRHQYDRAWRGTVGWDGNYKSIHAYGFNANGGTSYQMYPNDWQEMWRAEERVALLPPEAPIGVGVVVSTAKLNQPATMSFSGTGYDGRGGAVEIKDRVPRVVRRLQEAGVSVPFAANASALKDWQGDAPLVLLNLHEFSDDEVTILKALRDRDVKLVALVGPNEQPKLSAAAQELISTPDKVITFPVDSMNLTEAQANDLHQAMLQAGDLAITYPPGTGGYGFISSGVKFIVVEDWREQPRTLELRLHAATGMQHATALEMNEHHSLPLRRDGADWVITLTTRPGDGNLIMIREQAQ